jgi:hypothetical protein
VPFGVVDKATSKSPWCTKNAPHLSSGQAWWLRLRYLVAVVEYNSRNSRDGGRETNARRPLPQRRTWDKERVESMMMPRGAVSRQLLDLALASLTDIQVPPTQTNAFTHTHHISVSVVLSRSAGASFCVDEEEWRGVIL